MPRTLSLEALTGGVGHGLGHPVRPSPCLPPLASIDILVANTDQRRWQCLCPSAPVPGGQGTTSQAASGVRLCMQARGVVARVPKASVHLPSPSTLRPLAAAARCVFFGMIQSGTCPLLQVGIRSVSLKAWCTDHPHQILLGRLTKHRCLPSTWTWAIRIPRHGESELPGLGLGICILSRGGF